MDCSTPGLRAHHQLLEFAQTRVHRVGDAIQPSHPQSSPSPALSLCQHQGLRGLEGEPGGGVLELLLMPGFTYSHFGPSCPLLPRVWPSDV